MNTSFDHKDTPKNQRHSQHESQSAKTHPSRTIVHAKLEMTEPGDHDEQEADAMADAVVSGGKISRKISGGGGGSSGIAVSQQMESQLSQLQGGGRPMPQGLLNMMENGFGQDFGHVRIHTDAEAADMSSSISAKAFTLGNDIYFNRGQFNPETTEGQRLVAHELTHVVQGTGKVSRYDMDGAGWDRHAAATREFVSSFNTPFDPQAALNIVNLVNDLFATFNNVKALKEMYQLKELLVTIKTVADKELGIMRSTGDIVKATTKNANATTSKAVRRIGWAGVLLTLQDFCSTIKKLDFENNPKSSTAVIAIKTGNLASSIISQPSILAKVAAVSPTTAGLFFAFGAGYAAGDAVNILIEMLFGKAPGAAIVDLVMNKDLNKVTKDDVISYPKYASSRVYTELCIEYDKMEKEKQQYVTIVNPKNDYGKYVVRAFINDYKNSIKRKNDDKFLRFSFRLSAGFSLTIGKKGNGDYKYKINNFDITLLRKAFQNVGLY